MEATGEQLRLRYQNICVATEYSVRQPASDMPLEDLRKNVAHMKAWCKGQGFDRPAPPDGNIPPYRRYQLLNTLVPGMPQSQLGPQPLSIQASRPLPFNPGRTAPHTPVN